MKLDTGIFGITTITTSNRLGYLLVAYGNSKDLAIGLLRGRLDALSKYFSRVFDQLK